MAEKAIEKIRYAAELCRLSQLKETIECLQQIYSERPELIGREKLETVASDYQRLIGFMMSGFNDPKREELYSNLLRTVASVCANLELSWLRKNDAAYIVAISEANNLNVSHDFISSVLSDYVSDIAMLSLNDSNPASKAELNERHALFMQRLFASLFVSYQWSKEDADFYTELLLSPAFDAIDQQLIISGISLGCWNMFDIWKFACLINVYERATNASVRQRALVGWVFSFRSDDLAHPEMRQWVETLLVEKQVRRDIEEMQLQVMMCIKAPSDNDTIQKEIIPDLIKHSPVQMKNGNIEETKHDDLTEILHPEKDDENMEQIEKSMNRIMDMQRQGVDIYFGGFKMMKRFDFFHPIANWFLPFYTDHPALNALRKKLGTNELLPNLLENGPFCDSDRYSFAFALNQVIDRLPANIREMMNSAEAFGAKPLNEEERNSPSNLRRSYLQDLFRFFNIYPYRSTLNNIFNTQRSLFINRLNNADNLLGRGCFRIASILTKHHNYDVAFKVIKDLKPSKRNDYAVLLLISISEHKKEVFSEYINSVTSQFADDDELMAACARWYITFGNYDKAIQILKILNDHIPQKYELQLANTLLKLGKYEEATTIFYKLYYNNPTPEISRGLALAQLMTGRIDAATNLYATLARQKDHSKEDLLYLALAKWIRGNVSQAVTTLSEYIHSNTEVASPSELYDVIAKHNESLLLNGITDRQIRIVADAAFFDHN